MRPRCGFPTVIYLCEGGGVGSDQSEVLRIGDFRGLIAGIVDDPLDGIFPFRGVVCCSKRYMSLHVDRYLLGMLRHLIETCVFFFHGNLVFGIY